MTILENREIKQEVHFAGEPCRGNRRLREPRYSLLRVAGGEVTLLADDDDGVLMSSSAAHSSSVVFFRAVEAVTREAS